jgi:hypothetical protein
MRMRVHGVAARRLRQKRTSSCLQKLDRLRWTAALTGIVHGVRVGIRTNTPAILDDIEGRLPPGWAPRISSRVDCLYSLIVGDEAPRGRLRRFHLLYADAARLARTNQMDEVLQSFETDVEWSVAALAPKLVFVHAGVVGWQGRAVLIPGRSGSGKTRLVEALVRAGATYYSDEYAILDARGRVHPFARPLNRRSGDAGIERIAPAALGGRVGTAPLEAGMILATRYEPGARWRPRRLSPGRAMIELLAHTLPARLRPAQSLAALSRVTRSALAFKGVRGEGEDLARAVLTEDVFTRLS